MDIKALYLNTLKDPSPSVVIIGVRNRLTYRVGKDIIFQEPT
jgi:hypothetical protein